MFIRTEETPNPLTLKFVPGCAVMGARSPVEFKTRDEAKKNLLAEKLFHIIGIKSVFFGSHFLAITKTTKVTWSELKPDIFGTLVDYFTLHKTIDEIPDTPQPTNTHPLSDIEKEIQALIDTRIRPAVAMDGGDIIFERFDEKEGVVYLNMRGACAGCPSSTLTLKTGIENMLKHYIPEVKEVRSLNQDPIFHI